MFTNQTHVFMGNLTRDPESRVVAGSNGNVTVASFCVAVNGPKPEDTIFLECETWGAQADRLMKFMKKGKGILVLDSEVKNDNWVDKNTQEKRSRHKYNVNRWGFMPGPKTEESAPEEEVAVPPTPKATPKTSKPVSPPKRMPPPVETDEDEDDIPF